MGEEDFTKAGKLGGDFQPTVVGGDEWIKLENIYRSLIPESLQVLAAALR